MAKKTKRKVSSGISREPEILQTPTVETSAPVVRATATNRRVVSATEFNPDYSYVISDLKRIGMLAGIFFVVLIALSFIL